MEMVGKLLTSEGEGWRIFTRFTEIRRSSFFPGKTNCISLVDLPRATSSTNLRFWMNIWYFFCMFLTSKHWSLVKLSKARLRFDDGRHQAPCPRISISWVNLHASEVNAAVLSRLYRSQWVGVMGWWWCWMEIGSKKCMRKWCGILFWMKVEYVFFGSR